MLCEKKGLYSRFANNGPFFRIFAVHILQILAPLLGKLILPPQ
jgi:hypothetical protein